MGEEAKKGDQKEKKIEPESPKEVVEEAHHATTMAHGEYIVDKAARELEEADVGSAKAAKYVAEALEDKKAKKKAKKEIKEQKKNVKEEAKETEESKDAFKAAKSE